MNPFKPKATLELTAFFRAPFLMVYLALSCGAIYDCTAALLEFTHSFALAMYSLPHSPVPLTAVGI